MDFPGFIRQARRGHDAGSRFQLGGDGFAYLNMILTILFLIMALRKQRA